MVALSLFSVLFANNFCSGNIPVYIALKQNNISVLQDYLKDISNPESINYGFTLSREEIHQVIDPPIEDKILVEKWLNSKNIYVYENFGDAFKFTAPFNNVADMFNIPEYRSRVGSLKEYSIPSELEHIIDFVEMNSEYKYLKHTQDKMYEQYLPSIHSNVADNRFFGREPMMNMYNITNDSINHSTIGVLAEFQSNGGFLQSDLVVQQNLNNQTPNIVSNIVGKNVGINFESVLDVQLMSQAGNNIDLWFWNTPYWIYSFAVDFFNTDNIGNIVSISWGWAEDSQCDIIDCTGSMTSEKYIDRANIEFLKLALRGVSIVVSSGDAGAPGRTNEECSESRPINPVFPTSSPYVTSVGATYVPFVNSSKNNSTLLCKSFGCIESSDERSISFDNVGWTAGGGFEKYINHTPWWQVSAVESYLSSGVKLPREDLYNKKGRAYPDIVAIGHSCPVYVEGYLQGVDGTSCSAPVIGGLLGIIYTHLWKNYHIKLGFANPLLYYIHEHCKNCFNDIVIGYNWCTEQQCCDDPTNFGFSATSGYDPVSGLGSPNIGNIKQFIDNLFI